MCGCRKNLTNAKDAARAQINLRAGKKVPTLNFTTPQPKFPLALEDRKRIQRLHELAIRRSKGR